MPVEPPEVIEVVESTISCDGGGGPLDHPRVYLNLGADARIDCPYCDRQFILKAGAAAKSAH